MTNPNARDAVRTFAVALKQALFDRTSERAAAAPKIARLFLDADVVIAILRGYRASQPGDARSFQYVPSAEELLARSLIATGFLGRVHMLRSHALELYRTMRYGVERGGGLLEERLQAERTAFRNAHGIAELYEVLQGPLDESTKLHEFLQILRTRGAQCFTAIERTSGSWDERLVRLRPLFDTADVAMRDLFEDVEVRRLSKMLGQWRTSGPTDGSNLCDAAALVQLSRYLRAGEVVRFYTETPVLRRLWSFARTPVSDGTVASRGAVGEDAAWVRALLMAPGVADEDCAFVVRGAQYVVLRATFEALRAPDVVFVDAAPSPTSDVGEDELADLSTRLDLIIADECADGKPTLFDRVAKLELGRRPLVEVIRELRDLLFVEACWLRRPTREVRQLLGEIVNLPQEEQSKLYEVVRREANQLESELSAVVGRWEAWFRGLARVEARAKRILRRLHGHDEIDPMRDLGLIRWGFVLDEAEEVELRDAIRLLVSEDDDERALAYGRVAAAWEMPAEDKMTAIYWLSTLWLLELYDEVIKVVDQSRVKSPSFEVMRAAAEVRSGKVSRGVNMDTLVKGLRLRANSLASDERAGFLLGVGYVSYHAWKQATLGVGWELSRREGAKWLARESIECGRESLGLFEHGSLGWSFAINHCVYVSAVAEIDDPVIEEFVEVLGRLRGVSAHWHYRFADTLAMYYYCLARRDARAMEGGDVQGRRQACRRIDLALRFLQQARPDFGDPEIRENRDSILRLADKIGCPRRRTARKGTRQGGA